MFEPTYIDHRGVRILKLDYSGLSAADLLAAFEAGSRAITAAPRRSLRVLAILRSRLSAEAVEALKRVSPLNAPHVRASAVVGTAFWNVVVADLQARGRDEVQMFDDERAALDWLASTAAPTAKL